MLFESLGLLLTEKIIHFSNAYKNQAPPPIKNIILYD